MTFFSHKLKLLTFLAFRANDDYYRANCAKLLGLFCWDISKIKSLLILAVRLFRLFCFAETETLATDFKSQLSDQMDWYSDLFKQLFRSVGAQTGFSGA
jgi:hypothetical protein